MSSKLFMIVLAKSIKGVTSFISENNGPFAICQQDHLQDWKFVVQSRKQAQIRHDFGFVNVSIDGVRGFEFLKDSPGTDWRYLCLREEFGEKNGRIMKNMTGLESKMPCHLAQLAVNFAVQLFTIMAFIRILVAFYRPRNFPKVTRFSEVSLPSWYQAHKSRDLQRWKRDLFGPILRSWFFILFRWKLLENIFKFSDSTVWMVIFPVSFFKSTIWTFEDECEKALEFSDPRSNDDDNS